MQNIRTILLVVAFLFAFSEVKATNPPPANDTVCDAIDLGMLPIPGPCPSYPKGDTVHVDGTTNFASYNTFNFSPNHGFGSASPDVWYKFRGTGSFIYVEMHGYNDLDSFFVMLHYSQGSCLSLVPLYCDQTTNGFLQATFLTPDVGGEYYLQIGGSRYDESGDFMFFIKSYNECTECVKNASLSLSPSPWFGRYGTSDTVNMCVSVDRWELLTTSNLHSIVPVFGDEWDTTTLTPLVIPNVTGGWIWGQNVPTPAGSLDGFYFDVDGDGDPTNNAGDPGNVNTSWTACWSIATKPFCNTYDASIDVNIYSDNQTGAGNPNNQCQEYYPIHMALAGWCCPDPIITVTSSGVCSTIATISVDPVSVNSSDSFNIVLYDDSLNVVAYQANVVSTTAFLVTLAGDYILEVYNVSTGCPSYHIVHVPPAFGVELHQTAIGCGAGSGSVIATPTGGTAPYQYSWPGITTYTDSLAFSLNEGYVSVTITDMLGCSATDSIYVVVVPNPGANFDYADISYCSNDDTIQVYYDPPSMGGTYTLVSPTVGGITVDAANGTIYLNNTALPTPYWVYVKYTVGSVCQAYYVDSVQIVQQPAPPIATSAQIFDWCIGSSAPILGIAVGNGIPFWYDAQTTLSGFGYVMTPAIGSITTPGTYLYGFVYWYDATGGCVSQATIYAMSAHGPPTFTPGPDVTICSGDTAMLYVTGAGPNAYSWSPQPSYSPNYGDTIYTSPSGTTTYTISVSDGVCTGSGIATVNVLTGADCGLTIYNGITPNGDGQNDSWIIDGADLVPNMTVSIYNRWGQMVWKGNHYNNSSIVWRGDNQRGEALPAGTYFFTIEQDNREPSTGWIELNR